MTPKDPTSTPHPDDGDARTNDPDDTATPERSAATTPSATPPSTTPPSGTPDAAAGPPAGGDAPSPGPAFAGAVPTAGGWPTPEPSPKRSRRGLAVAGIAVAALLLLGGVFGGGVAVGSAIDRHGPGSFSEQMTPGGGAGGIGDVPRPPRIEQDDGGPMGGGPGRGSDDESDEGGAPEVAPTPGVEG